MLRFYFQTALFVSSFLVFGVAFGAVDWPREWVRIVTSSTSDVLGSEATGEVFGVEW